MTGAARTLTTVMQDRRLPYRPAAVLVVLAVLAVLPGPAAAVLSRRTCFCDLRLGRTTFSPLLLAVENPVLKDYLVSCRRAQAWCPDACLRAARNSLLQGSPGDVSPLSGAGGRTACAAVRRAIPASAAPEHVYATYRVSNCRHSGSHYLGRLCCRSGTDSGGQTTYEFNESCECEERAEEEEERAEEEETAAPSTSVTVTTPQPTVAGIEAKQQQPPDVTAVTAAISASPV